MYKAEEEIEAISIILFQGKYQGRCQLKYANLLYTFVANFLYFCIISRFAIDRYLFQYIPIYLIKYISLSLQTSNILGGEEK